MIPLRSLYPRSRAAIITSALVALNLLAFYYELEAGPALPRLIRIYGLRPALFSAHWYFLSSNVWFPVFSSMFLHGGWLHLAGNMLFLWVFGRNVEDRLGHTRFLMLYLLSGLAAALTQIWMMPFSRAPLIGASGAIAGILGAYLFLFPRARVLTLVPVFFIPFFWELPALVLLVFWFIGQFSAGLASLDTGQALYGGIAYWAHIGGFIAGGMLAILLQTSPSSSTRQNVWIAN